SPAIRPARHGRERARFEVGERNEGAALLATGCEVIQREEDADDGISRRFLEGLRIAAADHRDQPPEPLAMNGVDVLDHLDGASTHDGIRVVLELCHERIEMGQELLELGIGHGRAGLMSASGAHLSSASARAVSITRCRAASTAALKPSPHPSSSGSISRTDTSGGRALKNPVTTSRLSRLMT